MNMAYLFEIELHANDRRAFPQSGVFVSTGSQETRARRRVLDVFHSAGEMVRRIKLVDSKPAHEINGDDDCFGK